MSWVENIEEIFKCVLNEFPVKEINIEELRCKVLDISTKYIEESEEDESNSTTRS